MSLKLIDREEKKGLAKLWEDIDIWWYCHVTDKYRSVCCWFRICCNKRRWKLVKQAAFHTYPFSYEYFYDLQKTYMEELIAHYKHGYFATAETYEPIPSNCTNDPDSILSLLFYFGMITIDGSYQGYNRFVISNKATRQQIYKLLREENVQIGENHF